MDAIFVNKTVMNKDTCREFQKLTWGKNAGSWRFIMLGIAVLSVGYGVLQLVLFGSHMLVYTIGFVLLGVASLVLAQWGYLFQAGRYTREQQQLWKGPTLEKEVFFYEDRFVQKSKLGELTFTYNQMTGLKTGKNTMVILMGTGALLIAKDGFTTGNEANFITFIREKMAKPKDKKTEENTEDKSA